MPSTVVDCLEVSKMKNVTSRCRRWLRVVLGLALIYSVNVLMYKFPLQTREEGGNEDIQVTRYMSSETPCGLGCNMAAVPRKTHTSTAGHVALGNRATRITRWTPQPSLCRKESKAANDDKIRFKVSNLDFRNRINIKAGGYFKPRGCEPRSKVAIIVPYRNRETNLLVFLYNIHPFLVKQMLQYRIFVIEQSGLEKFNKGRLFNAGFDLVARFGSWHCMVFHDVNLLPMYARTSYSCPISPTQLSTRVVWLNQTYPHVTLFGGVTSMTDKHFKEVNGYSNMYWGSVGADDSNMYRRLRAEHIPVNKYGNLTGLFTMLPPPTEKMNTTRQKRISTGQKRKSYKVDGLSNSNYKTISIKLRSLYTHIVVDINPNKDPIE